MNVRVLLALVVLLAGCATKPTPQLTRYEFERPQMGVPFRIVLYSPSAELATNAAEAAFKRVSELNDIMSDYEYESELSKLGRTSGSHTKVKISDELWTVLTKAQEISRASNGALGTAKQDQKAIAFLFDQKPVESVDDRQQELLVLVNDLQKMQDPEALDLPREAR